MDKFPIMRSGIGNPYDSYKMTDEEMLDIGTLLSIFVKYGMEHAYTYVTHAGRFDMTATDIRYALQLEVFLFSTRKNLVEEVLDMRKDLEHYIEFGSSDEDGDDSVANATYGSDSVGSGSGGGGDSSDCGSGGGDGGGSIDIGSSDSTDYIPDEFVESKCDCELCKCMNKLNTTFPTWEPKNPLESILKNRIIEISEDTLSAFKELQEEHEYDT